jgi:hypothetical protein
MSTKNKPKAKAVKKQIALVEKMSQKEIKLNKANPTDRLDEIIAKVRVHYINEGDQEGYLWIKDIEQAGGGALLKGLTESKILKKAVAWNGNGQIRRLVLESVLRDHVDSEGAEPTKSKGSTSTPSDELSKVSKIAKGKPDMSVVPDAKHRTVVDVPGLKGGVTRINVLITQKEKDAARLTHVPQTFAEIKAALRPTADIEFDVKAEAIAEYCKAYSAKLIERGKLSKADLQATERWAYREPRRLLYTEFERIFAADPVVKEFVKNRKALPDGSDQSYIRAIHAAGLIDKLHNVAQAAFEDYLAKPATTNA